MGVPSTPSCCSLPISPKGEQVKGNSRNLAVYIKRLGAFHALLFPHVSE